MKTINEILTEYRDARTNENARALEIEGYWLWVHLSSAEKRGENLEEAYLEWLLD